MPGGMGVDLNSPSMVQPLFGPVLKQVLIPSVSVGVLSVLATNIANEFVAFISNSGVRRVSYFLSGPDLCIVALSLCAVTALEAAFSDMLFHFSEFLIALSFSISAFFVSIFSKSRALLRDNLFQQGKQYGRPLGWWSVGWSNLLGLLAVGVCAALLFRSAPPQKALANLGPERLISAFGGMVTANRMEVWR
jgi:hypothetical protein